MVARVLMDNIKICLLVTVITFILEINSLPIGFAIVRQANPSLNFQQYLSSIGKPSYDTTLKSQIGYNMISLDGYSPQTKFQGIDFRLSPIMVWKKLYQIVLSNKPNIYGQTSAQIQTYIKQKIFNNNRSTLLMNADLGSSPVGTYNAAELGLDIGNAVLNLQLDGVSIQFNDYNAIKDGTASDWLQQLIKSIISTGYTNIILIIPPTFVTRLKILKWPQINSIISYYILKYFDTVQPDYTSYQQIFEQSTYYTGSSLFQIQKKGDIWMDGCRTLIAKPASAISTWNSNQFVNSAQLASFLLQGYNKIGWFAGYANLYYETDLTGAFVNGVLGSLRQQCSRNQNCVC